MSTEDTNNAERYQYDFASVEALLKGVKGYDDAALLEQIKQQSGIDIARPKRQYGLETINAFLRVVGEARFPELDEREMFVELGRASARGYPRTLVGRVMIAPLKVISPERALQQMVKMFGTGQQFGERTLVKEAEQKYILQFRDDPGNPAFVEGLVRQFFEDIGLPSVRVAAFRVGQNAFDVSIFW